MNKSDFLTLAAKKWDEIEAQQKESETFYDYEKASEELWIDFGRQSFEGSLREVSSDRRKKRKA